MKIALVHDWLTGMRGGEKVLAELIRIFPSADVFTLLWRRGSVTAEIESRVRATSFLQAMPGITRAYRYYLPLFPSAVRSFDLSGYDLIISSSHAVAKGVRVPRGAVHVCYIHTPMRYLWDSGWQYFRFGRGRFWKRAALSLIAPGLKWFDLRSAAHVDYFVANSENVRERVRRIYGVDAEVIYPPVDTDFFTPCGSGRYGGGGYYLAVSSLESYKRLDLAVDAFSSGKRRLLIVGKGTLDRELRARAKPPVEFLGEVPNDALGDLYRHCRAVVFPGLEDFGMVPVEAQACGRPVICYGSGGATESVIDGLTGVHFRPQTREALIAAVERFEAMEWDRDRIRHHSLKFSRQNFRHRMEEFCRTALRFGFNPDEQHSPESTGADL